MIRRILSIAFTLILIPFWLSAQSGAKVRFNFGVETFPDNFERLKFLLPDKSEIANGRYVRYIRTKNLISSPVRAQIAASGIEIIGYVPSNVYLISIPEYYDLQQLDRTGALSIMPVQPEWKIARNLHERPLGNWAMKGTQVAVNVRVYPHVSLPSAAQLCTQSGWEVIKTGANASFLQLLAPEEQLGNIAAQPFVQYMELIPPPAIPEDTRGRSLHRANLLDSDAPGGKKYNGDGVKVLVRDDGIVGPHIDFQGRIHNQTQTRADNGTHGDGVAGIVTSSGNLDPRNKGMAPGAELYVVDYTSDFQDETLDLFLDENVNITNSSYSNGCNSGYTLATEIVDGQMYTYPTLVHVFSAGNANGDDCGSDNYGAGSEWANITGGHKQGKNSIAVANLNAAGVLDNTSSRGPAYDGRIKPDISANGTAQISNSIDNTYQTFGGTSGAAPGIAGCLAQLTHAYKTLHNGQEPEAAFLKALLINTANDLGNTGPDFKFGWGHVNAARALKSMESEQWAQGLVDHDAVFTQSLTIPAGVRQAKIMLYWQEIPAFEMSPLALVNDLDLTLSDAGANEFLPWKLDATPDPLILNTPAGKGRDSLNNMEQVAIENPAPGEYTITVHGAAVPLGPQPFYLTWEFLTDDIQITYPNGSEGFVPGETERIHWDAFGVSDNFVLQYSTDDGSNWQTMTTTAATARMYDWAVPNTISGKARVRIQRGASTDVSDEPFSIVPVPKNFAIEKACLDSITLSWMDIQDTLSYEVYMLGNKYMEVVQSSTTHSATFPIDAPQLGKWLSVRAVTPNGLTGRRALAFYWPGGLLNCPAPNDASVVVPGAADADTIRACVPVNYIVEAQFKNSGQNIISGASANYRFGNDPVVSVPLPDIAIGTTLDFAFPQAVVLSANQSFPVKIWVSYLQDNYRYNDTVSYDLVCATDPLENYFTQGFNGSSLPQGWQVSNPDQNITWSLTPALVTGPDGLSTNAVYLNCFSYQDNSQEDYLYLPPLDLHSQMHPGLKFDLAHARYSNSFTEALRVEVFSNCNPTSAPVVVWQKTDPQLATTANSTTHFEPDAAADWRTEYIDLQNFTGQSIFVRFVSENGYGNDIYLDNISFYEFDQESPDATFSASFDTICRGDTVIFQSLAPFSPTSTYTWQFGIGASPQSATGPGPHAIRFVLPGLKTPRLVVNNAVGVDTVTQEILVKPFPTTNFTYTSSDLNVTFTNTAVNAGTYLWIFGDGDTSTAANPVHLYPAPGNYIVRLVATNECGATEKVSVVILTSATEELSAAPGTRILPNPNTGTFDVELRGLDHEQVILSLLDMQGRLVQEEKTELTHAVKKVHFEQSSLAKGVYQLVVRSNAASMTYKVVVQ